MTTKLNWQDSSPKPDDDLLAHAITYADKINDARLPLLIKLNGYDAKTCTGTPRWGWRSYSFTMKALNHLGRTEEAIKLGHSYLTLGIVDGDTNKVLQELADIMRSNGQQAKAVRMLTDWLAAHPYAPAAQILTALLDWEDTAETETQIGWCTRGLRDLAEEQASTNHANFYYRRALARDKRALDAIEQTAKYSGLDICTEITRALADYDSAGKLDINPGLKRQVAFRKQVLARAAQDIGCGMSEADGPAFSTASETTASSVEDIQEEVQQALQEILPVIVDDDLNAHQKVTQAKAVLNQMSPIARGVLINNLRRASEDDAAPQELQTSLQAFFASYKP